MLDETCMYKITLKKNIKNYIQNENNTFFNTCHILSVIFLEIITLAYLSIKFREKKNEL
uniref:CSON013698 protein n=1 Tax=Culicoides sonorensis TaxID=179676 RepID=A0A336LI40_CULSO